MSRSKSLTAVIFLVALLATTVVTITLISSTVRRVEAIRQELRDLPLERLTEEKTRAEVLAARLETQLTRLLWNNVVGGLGTLLTAAGALVGAWIGFHRYLDTREKERLDRAAADLSEALKHLASDKPRERAVGVVEVQHFLSPDKREYHLRALSALTTAARSESDPEVVRGLRIAVEKAVEGLSVEILRRVSWQGARLPGVSLPGCDLSAADFRDAVLEDSDLSGAKLAGARFVAARLNGARLDGADLSGADLWYADLAGAHLRGATLDGANLRDAKVRDLDLEGAQLAEAVWDDEAFPWEQTLNWRRAVLPAELRGRLLARFGPEPHGPRVAMLLWEMPPLVAGGTWTAAYHLVRELRQSGADVVVVVPWDEALVEQRPFGHEVPVIWLGLEAPAASASPYSQVAWRWSAYGAPGAPTAYPPPWSAYGLSGGYSPYPWAPGTGASFSPYRTAGTGLLRLTEEVARRLRRHTRKQRFDLFHAHDWVTFPAARAVAERDGLPWIAHFHSTESERRATDPDPVAREIERQGARSAARVLAPSRGTAARIVGDYGVEESRVQPLPNPFSADEIDLEETGRYETRRVVFLGRLAEQKGADRLDPIARALAERLPGAEVWAYGAGELYPAPSRSLRLMGSLPWRERGRAFAGASAILVPSRAEPFGMVVLEAMLHLVPVFYPRGSGAAEVLRSGLQIDPADLDAVVEALAGLMTDRQRWEQVVAEQRREVEAYAARRVGRQVLEAWQGLVPQEATAPGGTG